jgi:uncharacterized protein
VKRAGELAELRALRGYDALHLASALVLRERVSSTVMFLAFDLELTRAAQRERLPRHPLSTWRPYVHFSRWVVGGSAEGRN